MAKAIKDRPWIPFSRRFPKDGQKIRVRLNLRNALTPTRLEKMVGTWDDKRSRLVQHYGTSFSSFTYFSHWRDETRRQP